MRVLGIESSCDETSVALVDAGRHIMANHVVSQIPVHARYGGVVPELASRNHIIEIIPAIQACLSEANMTLSEVDAFAVTAGPGLIGSLLVGVEVAKSLASSQNKPLIGVNHIEAHLMAPLMDYEGQENLSGTPNYPFLGLIVSGGHTHLYRVDGVGQYKLVGATRDDAAGEAFDKVAKMMGLPYPGGVQIDRAALKGDPNKYHFPRAMPQKTNFDYSFSGVKTSVRTHLLKQDTIPQEGSQDFFDLCASFQEAVVDSLVTKLFRAARAEDVHDIVISGGVSANSRLRQRALEVATSNNIALHIPPLPLCTDNAAMIAALGYHYLPTDAGFDAWTLNASPSLPMGKAEAVTHP